MNPQISAIDFNERPFIAIWEVTQACDLACVHCRASAQPDRHPRELSINEGKHLINQIAAMNVPVFVLTGGDPIKRPDLFELIEHARSMGVRVSLTPSATPLLTKDIVVRLKAAGLARLAVSMDGASSETHDAFRGMAGSFSRTLDAIRWANEIGLSVQINTTFSRRNIAEIDAIVTLMDSLKIILWSVFFLVRNANELHLTVDSLYSAWIASGRLSSNEEQRLVSATIQLKQLYEGHIQIEERIVFPRAAEMLDSGTIEAIGQEFRARRE